MSWRCYCLNIFKKIVIFVYLVFSVPSFGSAESIQLKSGKTIDGTIVERTDESIQVNIGSEFPFTYYLDEIESIDGESVTPKAQETIPVEDQNTEIIAAPELENPEPSPSPAPPEIEAPIPQDSDVPVPEEPLTQEPPQKPMVPVESQPVNTPPSVNITSEPLSPSPAPAGQIETQHLLLEPSQELSTEKPLTIPPQETKNKFKFPENIYASVKTGLDKTRLVIASAKSSYATVTQKIITDLPKFKKHLYEIPLNTRRNFLLAVLVLIFIFYFLMCFPFMGIASQLGKKFRWLVWVPVVHIFYFLHLAEKRWYWFFFLLIPLVNIFVILGLLWGLLKTLRRTRWLIFPLMIPLLNIVILWFIALHKRPNGSTVPFKKILS